MHNCLEGIGIVRLMQIDGRTDRTKFRNQVLNLMLEAGWLEKTIPDNPTSSKQQYRLTEQGKELLERK